MSYIAFHSPGHEDVRLRGSERFHMAALCRDIATGFYHYDRGFVLPEKNPLYYAAGINPYCMAQDRLSPKQMMVLFLSGVSGAWQLGERKVSLDLVALNTALAVGSDPIRLAARLHGQAEIHTWVAGENRRWLADIIAEGRSLEIFRENVGWEAVRDLLLSSDSEPVVTSYSVSESFPHPRILPGWDYDDEEEEEAAFVSWYDLPPEEQWSQAFSALKRSSYLEMRPDAWNFPVFHFEDADTVFTIQKEAERLYGPVIEADDKAALAALPSSIVYTWG